MFPILRRVNSRLNYQFFKQHNWYLQAATIANKINHKSINYPPTNLLLEINSIKAIQSTRMYATCKSKIKEITFDDVRVLKMKENVYLIDVRERCELQEKGIIPDSINIPLNELENTLKRMEKKDFVKQFGRQKPELDTPLIFSCQSGIRSTEASETALKLGYKNINNYRGGYAEWAKKIKY